MTRFPLFKVHVNVDESLLLIKDVLTSGYINEGVYVQRLTDALRQRMQTMNLCLTNSGTSALTMALRLSNVGHDDEVITTPMTCVATNTPIACSGAKIVWADIDSRTGSIDPVDVERKITKKTKAVMAVAWAGTPPNMNELLKICNKRHIKLILDAAHAFDALYEGCPVHRFAHFTCYSFQAIKHFTTGDGGAIVSTDADDHCRAKALKWFGMDRDRAKDEKGNWKGQQWDVDIQESGYKFNMNNLAAAVGLSQLPYIDSIMEKHRSNASLYDDLLEKNNHVDLLQKPNGSLSSSWVYTLKVNERSKINRDDLLVLLNNEGIMAGIVHVPNDSYSAFADCVVQLPGVRDFSSKQFSLPCGWWLNDADIRHITTTLLRFV